ncbi:hypothetical protein HY086_05175 [Candidatus Gottesmanbacteria bacterium]|nr:hypothetical protein [Candidatus Gottesmanbacteria bacterium]
MDFYNDLVTQKSWQTLQSLKKTLDFVVIGGWAVWLYTKALKSKDIDIIVDYDQLEKLRKLYPVSKNDRLKKYEARNEEVQIDIYLPHYSKIGIPVEDILKTTQSIDAFRVPAPDKLLALKLYVYSQRKLSAKGQKDRLDILSLLLAFPQSAPKPLPTELATIVKETTKIPELGVNEHAWSKLKKKLLSQSQ